MVDSIVQQKNAATVKSKTMKKIILTLVCGVSLLGAVASALAQGTVTITGTGSGTLNGIGFSNNSFLWTLTYSTNSPYTGFGANSTVYTTLTSQISLQGGPAFNVTSSTGTWINYSSPGSFNLAPMSGIPGSNILTISGTPGWNGFSAFTSQANPSAAFNQFVNVATAQGALTMSSGSVSLVTISGAAPVPEPSTYALMGIGALALVRKLRPSKSRVE
jgi:PEP-CTERM motif-containing protein